MKITRVLQSTIFAAVVVATLLMNPAAANARVFVSVGFAPPAIPVYVQPVAPAYGYIWTPGYWAYGPNGYYWVDGAWVEPPYEGALWTPGYWGYSGGVYVWSPGYWGRHVGYYGGVNYGFGYFGVGFWGGYWNGGHFFYNREYNHLGFRDHEGFVYSHPVAGFNGRPGGEAFARGQAAGYNHTAIAENRSSVVNGNIRPAYSAPHSSYYGGGSARGSYGGGARTGGGGGAHFSGEGGGRR
jgi:uncharacterized membrane protein YgcG